MNLLLGKAKSAYTEQQRESSFLNEENSIFWNWLHFGGKLVVGWPFLSHPWHLLRKRVPTQCLLSSKKWKRKMEKETLGKLEIFPTLCLFHLILATNLPIPGSVSGHASAGGLQIQFHGAHSQMDHSTLFTLQGRVHSIFFLKIQNLEWRLLQN